jgi:hypothetical protein
MRGVEGAAPRPRSATYHGSAAHSVLMVSVASEDPPKPALSMWSFQEALA